MLYIDSPFKLYVLEAPLVELATKLLVKFSSKVPITCVDKETICKWRPLICSLANIYRFLYSHSECTRCKQNMLNYLVWIHCPHNLPRLAVS